MQRHNVAMTLMQRCISQNIHLLTTVVSNNRWAMQSLWMNENSSRSDFWASQSAIDLLFVCSLNIPFNITRAGLGGSVGCASDWRPGGRGFEPRRGRQHSFVEIDHELFSAVIPSLSLIQEGQ